MIDWGVIVSQVPSIAVALLFAWFVDRIQNRWGKQTEERDQMWRDFLNEQRDRHAESTARLAEEIKQMNLAVAANTQQLMTVAQLLVQHDNRIQYTILEDYVKDQARKGSER